MMPPSYQFHMYGAADEVVPLLVKGDIDAAAVPANLAATPVQQDERRRGGCLRQHAGRALHRRERRDRKLVGDLKGQTIVTTGKGHTPEYVLRYVLTENGIDPDNDVTIEYCSEATEALSKVQAGEATIAMLPQPFRHQRVVPGRGPARCPGYERGMAEGCRFQARHRRSGRPQGCCRE